MDVKCPHNSEIHCNDCRMNALCLPIALQNSEIDLLNSIVERDRPFQKNDTIYAAGDAFKSIYAVRSGAIKGFATNNEGVEQVTGFYLPGEIFGIDGIGHPLNINSAIALETSAICEIPFSRMEELSSKIPSLQRHFFNVMSREITNDQQLITLLSKNSADERIATLLLSISARNTRRNLSGSRFRLPMSRADIGNYLGLTVETVSRVFSRLQKQKVLIVDKKEISVIDLPALQTLANV